MADATYQPSVYREQGGNRLVVKSGGEIKIESGGSLNSRGVTWTLASSCEHKKQIDGQLTDGDGTALAGNYYVKLVLLADVGGAAYAAPTTSATLTTGSGATACKVHYPVAGSPLVSHVLTSTGGAFSLLWTDTGKATAFIGAVLPSGAWDISTAAITTTS
jgi:hypothetical protein